MNSTDAVSYEEIVTIITLNLIHNFWLSDEDQREVMPDLNEGDWYYHHSNDLWSGVWCDILASVGVMRRVHRCAHALNVEIEFGKALPIQRTSASASFECLREVLCGIQFYDVDHRVQGMTHFCQKIDDPKVAISAIESSFRKPPAGMNNHNPFPVSKGANQSSYITFPGGASVTAGEQFFEWVQLCSFGLFYRLGVGHLDKEGSLVLDVQASPNSHFNDHDNCFAYLETLKNRG